MRKKTSVVVKLVIELMGITSTYLQSHRIGSNNNQETQLAVLKEINGHTLPFLSRPFPRVDNGAPGGYLPTAV